MIEVDAETKEMLKMLVSGSSVAVIQRFSAPQYLSVLMAPFRGVRIILILPLWDWRLARQDTEI